MPARRQRLKKYIDWGVDVVVGHHSHTTQGWEQHGAGWIFYSLGNFVFDLQDHRLRQYTDVSGLVSITCSKERLDFETIPIRLDWQKGVVVAGEESFHKHLQHISDFSDYPRQWREDAYRVLFGRRPVSARTSGAASSGSSRTPPGRLRRLLNPDWYRAQLRRLKSPNTRPILLAATGEALRRRVRQVLGTRGPANDGN